MATATQSYFAYASNLLEERVRHTLGKDSKAKVIGPAKLQDYDICFDFYSEDWKGCKATAREAPGQFIWGLLWEVSAAERDLLSKEEEVHLGRYREIEVDVTTPDGVVHPCFSYQLGEIIEPNGRPSPQYKDVIVRGARRAGLPDDYVSIIAKKGDNGYSGKLPIYEEIMASVKGS